MGPWRSKEGIIILNIATYFSCFGEIPAPMPPQSFRHPIREAVKLRLYTESLLTFALQCLQHKLTCSFQNLKSHQKTQDMMASIFAVWESGKTGEARATKKTRARQHLTLCHYSRYDGGHVQSNSTNAST